MAAGLALLEFACSVSLHGVSWEQITGVAKQRCVASLGIQVHQPCACNHLTPCYNLNLLHSFVIVTAHCDKSMAGPCSGGASVTKKVYSRLDKEQD